MLGVRWVFTQVLVLGTRANYSEVSPVGFQRPACSLPLAGTVSLGRQHDSSVCTCPPGFSVCCALSFKPELGRCDWGKRAPGYKSQETKGP